MRYLITGGAGFIGSHLSDALIARGDLVLVLDNLSTGRAENIAPHLGSANFEFVKGSILDEKLVHELMSDVDYVVHLAAAVGVFNIINKPLDSLTTNLRGTENILEAAALRNIPVVIASSSEVYGKNSNVPLNEESDRIIGSPLKSRWSYSEAKAIDESMGYFYFSEKGLPVRLVRFFNTVGPRQVGHYGMVVPRFVEAALAGSTISIYGDGTQSRCFCHVADAVAGLMAVMDSERAIGQVFNVGNNFEISIHDLAKKIIELTASASAIEFKAYSEAYGAGFEDMQRRVPDIAKMETILGWKPNLSLATIVSDISAFLKATSS